MAYSYVKYTGNGSTTNYSIPFTYISKDYLEIKVNNVLTTAYTLPSASTIAFTVAPPNGQIVEIRRNTPKTARLVDFQDASILTEAALDLDSDQAFHITQETQDLAVDGVGQAVTDAAAASAASAANAAASYDSFDDRYLGAKAADPTLDNDGAALLVGALYWNTALNIFKAWSGTAWAAFTVNAQPLDDQLTTLAAITATQATDLAALSAFMGTLLNDATAQGAMYTLGVPLSVYSTLDINWTVQNPNDRGRLLDFTGVSRTLSLGAIATYEASFTFAVRNSGTGTITVDPDGVELIDSAASITFAPGESGFITKNGTVWKTVGKTSVADGSITAPKLSGAQTGAAPVYGARAWVNFIGSTGAINASGNVSSVTRNGVGDYTINFTVPMPDANYSIALGMGSGIFQAKDATTPRTTTACRLQLLNFAGAAIDDTYLSVAIFR